MKTAKLLLSLAGTFSVLSIAAFAGDVVAKPTAHGQMIFLQRASSPSIALYTNTGEVQQNRALADQNGIRPELRQNAHGQTVLTNRAVR